jgi:large subunit ribosomal protein L17
MHRHGVQQRKLSMKRDQRGLLVRGQITSLVLHEAIVTTEAKAKTVAPAFERLVTKAKRANLTDQRAVRQVLTSENAALKLFTEIAPALKDRQGGYTRIIKLPHRLGDGAPMAQLSIVMDGAKPAVEKAAKAEANAPVKAKEAPADAVSETVVEEPVLETAK